MYIVINICSCKFTHGITNFNWRKIFLTGTCEISISIQMHIFIFCLIQTARLFVIVWFHGPVIQIEHTEALGWNESHRTTQCTNTIGTMTNALANVNCLKIASDDNILIQGKGHTNMSRFIIFN